MTKLLAAVTVLALAAGAAGLLLRDEPEAPAPETPAGEVDLRERRGALVDQVVFSQEGDVGRITSLIEKGSHHVFTQGITTTTVFRRLRDSPQAAHDLSYGTSTELSINPAGPRFENGLPNPFHAPPMREALNWLIDRRYIAEELYGGLAVPRVLPLNTAFPDYARLAEVARRLELRYEHDPERAEAIIHRELERLGARLEEERWTHEGRVLRLTILIRTEDERRRVGDYVANLLEDVGFEVERLYRTAEEASRIWIAGDPKAGEWHLYTGGWVSPVINRDLAGNLNFYYTPRGRPEALWQTYRPGPELDTIAERLERRDYATWEERQALMARGLELAMRNSVRIWLVDQLNVWARASDVELAVDLAGGISGSALWPFTVRFRDRVGGEMVFATPSLLTEPWNPVAGSNWIYDTMILRGVSDSALLPDPFTGLYWPQRIESATVTVEAQTPVIRTHEWLTVETAPEIRVPADAWIGWDARAGRLVSVGEAHPDGLGARTHTRVRYEADYLERRWHDGSRVSLADLLLPWILNFERADEASALHDPSHVPTFEVFRRHFRGLRIVARAPLTVDIWSDQIYPDAEWIVAARTPAPLPWHMLALAIRAETNGELAFSSNKADRLGVTWTSLVAGPSLPVLERHLQEGRERAYVPFAGALAPFMEKGEARARYRALGEWFEARGHFWVDDGPFYLHSVHPIERSVILRRYAGFPDPAGKWLRFTDPPVPELDLDGPMLVELDEGARFELRITWQGEPYPRSDIERVKFLLFDASGTLALDGEAQPAGGASWVVTLSAEDVRALGSGANSLEVAVSSRRVALPAFVSHGFATVPEGSVAGARAGS